DGIVVTELIRPRLESAVARDFVVLNGLGSGKKASVQGRFALVFLHHFLAFLDDAKNGIASLALWAFVQRREYLLEPLDLTFGLIQVLFKSRLEFARPSRLGHLGQSR